MRSPGNREDGFRRLLWFISLVVLYSHDHMLHDYRLGGIKVYYDVMSNSM